MQGARCLSVPALLAALYAQDLGGFRGAVVSDYVYQPISAQIEASSSELRKTARAGTDGQFQIGSLPQGVYELKLGEPGFRYTIIKGVQLAAGENKILPSIALDLGSIADCGNEWHPDYYRLLDKADAGAVAGIALNEKAARIGRATVTLYDEKGRVSSVQTDDKGFFIFDGLAPRPKKYRISVNAAGYFSEEVSPLTIHRGYESVYEQIILEECSPGRCEPYLKRIHVIAPCA